MHHGLMEELETRTHDITMEVFGTSLNSKGNEEFIHEKKSKWKHLLDRVMQDPKYSLTETSVEDPLIWEGNKCFIRQNSWDEVLMTWEMRNGKGLKIFSINEVVGRNVDDLKVKWGMYVCV